MKVETKEQYLKLVAARNKTHRQKERVNRNVLVETHRDQPLTKIGVYKKGTTPYRLGKLKDMLATTREWLKRFKPKRKEDQ